MTTYNTPYYKTEMQYTTTVQMNTSAASHVAVHILGGNAYLAIVKQCIDIILTLTFYLCHKDKLFTLTIENLYYSSWFWFKYNFKTYQT